MRLTKSQCGLMLAYLAASALDTAFSSVLHAQGRLYELNPVASHFQAAGLGTLISFKLLTVAVACWAMLSVLRQNHLVGAALLVFACVATWSVVCYSALAFG